MALRLPGDKYFIATYCRTEIINGTGISFRNKTMAVNYRLFETKIN